MTNEVKNVPELRFPGFEGEWLSYALKDVKDPKDKYSFTGGPFGSDLKKSDYKDNGIRIIQLQNINDGNFNDNYKIYTSSEKADILKSCNIYPGDIVIAKMADPLARATILPQNKENRYLMASDAIRLKVDDKSFNKIFMVNYINSRRFRRQAEDNSSGSTRMRIGLVTLGQLKISSPNKKEQDIIGDFFSKLDRQIELEEQKLEKLEEQKKGYMQKIFSQELRFKDDNGNSYPDWSIKKIEDISKVNKGFTPNTKNDEYWDELNENWLSIAGMTQKYLYKGNKGITEKGASKHVKVDKDTLIMSFKLTLGKLAIVKEPIYTNEAICHFVWKESNVNTEYMYYYLNSINISTFGAQAVKGVTLNNDSINSIIVKLPVIQEQNKIAYFFNELDKLIRKQYAKIELLKQRKNGLLQKMFV